ncbi:hypothetical protein EI94DRAFT_1699022 [Lactarius quietus]|nr:hypothetical protein EI94DRAFT_1699022 [Lactarius quietus]
MPRSNPLYADITDSVQSAPHRHPREEVNEEESRRDRMSATSGHLEPVKGRSAGFHNGRLGTGTGNVYARRTPLFNRNYPLPPTPITRRKMRKLHLVAALPIFASFASAQLVIRTVVQAGIGLNQNPCNVAAYLEATCGNGLFEIPPLPQGVTYGGPYAGQGNPWNAWQYNCTNVSSDGTYPNAIPSGTRIPHWAYLDVSVANTWNATAAQSAGDKPEGSPGASTSTSTTSAPTSTNSSTSSSSSNTGAIAGGVVGGLLGATVLFGFLWWYFRYRPSRRAARPSPFMTDEPHVAQAFGIDPVTTPSPPPNKYYTTPGSEQTHGPLTPPPSGGQYSGRPIV